MELSREILKQFAQIANGNSNKKQTTPSYMNATAVVSDGVKYVQIDGSDQLTPVSETMGIQNGDRVLVTIENHQATVIGNYSYPADARTANEALSVGGQALTAAGQAIQRIDVLQASSITTENLQAGLASIGYLTATELRALNATVDTLDAKAITTDTLETESAKIGFVKAAQIEGTYATIEQLKSTNAKIETLEAGRVTAEEIKAAVAEVGYLKASEAELKYATIEQLNAKTVTAEEILGVVVEAGYLTANNADLKYATINSLNAATARIGTLETDTLKTKDLESEVGKFGYLKASNLESEVGKFGYLKASEAALQYATIGALNAEAANISNLNAEFATFKSTTTQDLIAAKGWMAEGSIGDAQISKVSANKLDAGTIDTSVVTVKSSDGKLQIADNTLQISDANRVRVQVGKDDTGDYTLAVWDVNGQLIWDALGATENTIQRAIIRDSMVAGDAAIQALKIDFQSFETALTEQGIVISGTVVQVGDKSLNVALTEQSQTISDNYTSLVSYTDTAKAAAISTAASDATTKANSALSSAKSYADEAVEGIEIGGRNLLEKTNQGTTGWNYSGNDGTHSKEAYEDTDGVKGVKLICETASSGWAVASFTMVNVLKKLLPNTEYTISCEILTNVSSGAMSMCIKNMNATLALSNSVQKTLIGDESWHKYEWKITTNDLSNGLDAQILYIGDVNHIGYWIIKNLKMEIGTKATDWTPAPEDTQSQIDNTNATIATNTETLSTHTSQIAANESAIALRVTTQDFNSYKTTVNEELTSAKSRLTTAESSITAMKGEIALKVEQTDIDTAVNGIEIGGRNLLRNSNWATGNSIHWGSTGATIKVIADTTFEHALSFVTSSPGSVSYRIFNDINLFTHTSGEIYTLSFYIRADSTTTVLTSVAAAQKIKVHEVTTDWVRHTVTYTANMAGPITFWPVEANITIYLANVKLEKGTKATDWTPAPEDIDANIASISTRVSELSIELDGITQRVSATETTTTGLESRVSTAESKLTKDGLVTTIGSYYTTLGQLNNAIDGIDIGGRNLIRHSYIVNRGCSSFSYDKASNTWTCVAQAGSSNWGYGFAISSNKKIIIPRGRTFIVSLEVNPEVECEWINDVNNDSTLTHLSSNDNDNMSLRKNSSTLLPPNKWTKVWFSYTAKNDVEYDLYDASSNFGIVTTDLTEDVNFQFRNVMGELANKPSEYSPAPEDIDASIADVDAKFANYSTTTKMTAAITAAKDNITQSVSATYATKSDLSTTNSNVSSLTTRVSSAESKLTKDSLVTTIGSYYSTQTYVDEAVEGIEIGGRNLLIGSSDASNLGVWVKQGWSPNIETYNADERTYLLSSNNGWGAIGYPVSEYIGQTLTISGWVKLRDDSTNTEDVILAYTTEDTVTYNHGLDAPSGYRIALSKEEWRYTSATFDSAKNYIKFFFRGRNSDGGTGKSYVLIKDLKIEKGNRATDWTPAPEDVDSQITSVKTIATQTADKFNWLVASGTSSTDFTLTDRTATLIAQKISLNGYVKVNGNMIVDGSITTDKLYAYSVTTEKLATDAIKSSNYSYSSGNFSSAGTFLDLTTGLIRSKNFAITSDGSAYFSGLLSGATGTFDGDIRATSITAYEKINIYAGLEGAYTERSVITTADWTALQYYTVNVGLPNDGAHMIFTSNGYGTASAGLVADIFSVNCQLDILTGGLIVRFGGIDCWENLSADSITATSSICAGGEIQSTSANAFRCAHGSAYGMILRTDDANFYLLPTASGDVFGSWSSYRPFTYTFASGKVQINNSSFDTSGNLYVSAALLTGGKTTYNDANNGAYIGSDGTIHLAHNSTPGIYFHYARSTSTTSSIIETASGTLKLSTTDYILLQASGFAVRVGTWTGDASYDVVVPVTTANAANTGKVFLGAASARWKYIYTTNSVNVSSDERDKNITALDDRYLNAFDKLNVVTYRWKNDTEKLHIGLSAQATRRAMLDAGIDASELGAIAHDFWTDDQTGEEMERYSLCYEEIAILTIPVVQKHSGILTEHAAKLINIEAQLEAMKVELDEAHIEIARLKKLVNAS